MEGSSPPLPTAGRHKAGLPGNGRYDYKVGCPPCRASSRLARDGTLNYRNSGLLKKKGDGVFFSSLKFGDDLG